MMQKAKQRGLVSRFALRPFPPSPLSLGDGAPHSQNLKNMLWFNAMIKKSKGGLKLLGVNLLPLLAALVGLLLVIQYLATRQILAWHRQRVELVARLVLAEYQGKIQLVMQAANLLADNPSYGELLAAGNIEALRSIAVPMMKATGLHLLTITDDRGVITVRAHAAAP